MGLIWKARSFDETCPRLSEYGKRRLRNAKGEGLSGAVLVVNFALLPAVNGFGGVATSAMGRHRYTQRQLHLVLECGSC